MHLLGVKTTMRSAGVKLLLAALVEGARGLSFTCGDIIDGTLVIPNNVTLIPDVSSSPRPHLARRMHVIDRRCLHVF